MSRTAHGSERPAATSRDLNGFVNRRSTVQSRPSAPRFQPQTFTRESARAAIAGFRTGRVTARTAQAALAWLLQNPLALVRKRLTAGELTRSESIGAVRRLVLAVVS